MKENLPQCLKAEENKTKFSRKQQIVNTSNSTGGSKTPVGIKHRFPSTGHSLQVIVLPFFEKVTLTLNLANPRPKVI